MLNTVRLFYYTPRLDKLVKIEYAHCDICHKNKTRRGRPYDFLSRLGPAKNPFGIVSLDTISGFGGNRSTKKYLHLSIDHFSRYSFYSTFNHQSTEDFIKLVKKIQHTRQIHTLLTDQYGGINSTQFKNYLENHNINLLFMAVDCACN